MKKYSLKIFLCFASILFFFSLNSVLAQTAGSTSYNSDAYNQEMQKAQQQIMDQAILQKRQMINDYLQKYPSVIPIIQKYYDEDGNPRYDFSDPAVVREWAKDIDVLKEKAFKEAIVSIVQRFEEVNKEKAAKNEGPLQIKQESNKANLPNEKITLKAENLALNPTEHYYYWFVDDQLQDANSGIGRDSFVFKSSTDIGAKQKIRAVTNPTPTAQIKNKFETVFQIQTADIDLNYKAMTYVPADYPGKNNASNNSSVMVEAVPFFIKDNGEFINTGDLYFTWKNVFTDETFVAGMGKSSIVLKTESLSGGAIPVVVEVENILNKIKVRKSIAIQTVMPQILFNQIKDAKEGKTTSGEFSAASGECVEIKAKTYFFSITNPNSDLDFKWTADNVLKDCSKPEQQKIPGVAAILLPPKENLRGQAASVVYVDVKNKKNDYQFTQTAIILKIK